MYLPPLGAPVVMLLSTATSHCTGVLEVLHDRISPVDASETSKVFVKGSKTMAAVSWTEERGTCLFRLQSDLFLRLDDGAEMS